MSECVAEVPLEVEVPVAQSRSVPGFYYGWVMLPVAVCIFIATFPGQTFGVSVFNEPIRQSLGLTHGQLALAYTLGTFLASLPLTFIGGLIDRQGLRKATLLAIFSFGTACLILSQAVGWFTLFFSFLLLRLLGPGALSLLSSNTLAFWFRRRLGLVEGVRQLGMAGAMVFIPLLNLWLVQKFGWRNAYVVLGFAIWLLVPMLMLFFRERPESVGQRIDRGSAGVSSGPKAALWGFTLQEALRTRAFWIVCGGTSLFGLVHTAVFFCIVPILAGHGVTGHDAAAVLTTFAISLAVMHVVGGSLADFLPARMLLPLALGGLGVALLILLSTGGSITAHSAGILMGLSQGLFFGTSNPLWARFFGLLHLGKIRGAMSTINVAGSSIGPLLAGMTRDQFGSFDLALQCFCIASFIAAGISLFVSAPPSPAMD